MTLPDLVERLKILVDRYSNDFDMPLRSGVRETLSAAATEIESLRKRVAAADHSLDLVEEFLGDFVEGKPVPPGRLERAITTWRKSKGDGG